MKEPNFIQKIFSVTNVPEEKIIYLFGLKFELARNKIFKTKYGNLPIDKNKIVFAQFSGKGFGDNPKYIAKEIIKQKLPYKLVWLVKDTANEDLLNEFPPEIKIINFRSKKALKELATAKLWIDNQKKLYFLNKGLIKKEGQKYIQTWHGSLGIKKFGGDLPDELTENFKEKSIKDSNMTDYLLSNSEFENKIFPRAQWYNNEIVMLGHPRNDILINGTKQEKELIREKLNLPNDVKLALYAPTYRDDGRLYCYGLEYQNIIKSLENKFGDKWILLMRLHPNAARFSNKLVPAADNIVDVSAYQDMQELLLVSDLLITDYSSCIFDFMLTGKPAFIYANDFEEYNNDRGFYYSLKDTPFPVAQTNCEMTDNIANFNEKDYKIKVDKFLQSKGCIEDGKASKRVVELIKSIMEK